jgi:hypothetical protein
VRGDAHSFEVSTSDGLRVQVMPPSPVAGAMSRAVEFQKHRMSADVSRSLAVALRHSAGGWTAAVLVCLSFHPFWPLRVFRGLKNRLMDAWEVVQGHEQYPDYIRLTVSHEAGDGVGRFVVRWPDAFCEKGDGCRSVQTSFSCPDTLSLDQLIRLEIARIASTGDVVHLWDVVETSDSPPPNDYWVPLKRHPWWFRLVLAVRSRSIVTPVYFIEGKLT